MALALWRIELNGVARLARGTVEHGPQALLPVQTTLAELLRGNAQEFAALLRGENGEPVPAGARLLAPVDAQEIWAAGVTYERSREARREESKLPDQYERVYDARRPEIFFKSAGQRARGSDEPVGIRADSNWDVPEPELGLVVSSRGEVVGYTIGNDMSSRSIEGENALYLPQAKYYTGSCAVGPCVVPVGEAPPIREMTIALSIERAGVAIFDDTVAAARMKRTPEELVEWLFLAQEFPEGVILLTGTGLVPAGDFTLEPGDEVSIAITGLGRLRNKVLKVGKASPVSRAPNAPS